MKLFAIKLFSLLSLHDKKFLFYVFLFSICISLMETVGVAIIMPFISVASDFEVIHSNIYYEFFYQFFHFGTEVSFVIAFGILLIIFYFFRSAINLIYFYFLSKFSRGRYHLLAFRLFENYLGRSYKNFLDENSSNLSKTIINEAQNLTNILSSLLFMMSEIFVVIFIYFMMIYMNWKITLLLSLILFINALFLVKTVSPKIKKEGSKREEFQRSFYEILNTTFGNFKMIKLKSNDKKILEKFSNASFGFAKSNIINETIVHFPRLFLEALGFIIVIFIVIYLIYKNQQDIAGNMPLISVFILGLYRLMPSANRILAGYNQIQFYSKSLDIVHNDLIYEIEDLGDEKITFEKNIIVKHLSFGYSRDKLILKDISIMIEKNSKIGFIGESGSGKSTLIDLLMGLYRPQNGSVMIDDVLLGNANVKNWRSSIGYIPQNIYLFDGSIAQNIAFGEVYDEEKVKKTLKKANLLEFLEANHSGIETRVGENGLKLSGGQRQRVAIARAIYNNPEVLILDEATSSLDTETEKKIMDEIYDMSENKTLIIIAHRLSTLEKCDRIYRLNNGEIA